jgi:predicted dehydrogenase
MSYSYHHTAKHPKIEFVYELIGTEGVIRYDGNAKSFRMENTSGTHEFAYHHEKSFSGMYAEWANALLAGTSDLLPDGEDGMKVADIARRATDAAIMNRRTTRSTAEEMP